MKLILQVFLVIITSACTTLKNLSPLNYTIEPIKENEFTKLNGKYYDIQDTVFGKIERDQGHGMDKNNKRLLDRLFIFYPDKIYKNETSTEITFISNKKAIVNAYQNGTILFTKCIRGKFKNGYFYVRPKIFLIPFFPLFYWHNFERVRIGKTGDKLVVDYKIKSWGFALVAGGSYSGNSTSIYSRHEK